MPGDVPRPKPPEESKRKLTPADLARRLRRQDVQRKPPTTTERDVPIQGKQSARTNVMPPEKSALAKQVEGTSIEKNKSTTGHLDRLGRIDASSLSGPLQEVTATMQSELTKAIGYYKDGRRIEEESLRNMIGRVGGPYMMYMKGNSFSYPEQRLIDKTSGAVSELRHTNRLVESGQATSAIILGAQHGREYTLQSPKMGAIERIRISPVKDADILYLGRDRKVHIDEVKETVNALRSTLRKGSDQLQNLAAWRNRAPERREARIVLDRSTLWAKIFEKLDTRQSTSPSIADLLVEHRIPICIDGTTIKHERLATLKGPIQQALESASGAERENLLKRISPTGIEQGRFQA